MGENSSGNPLSFHLLFKGQTIAGPCMAGKRAQGTFLAIMTPLLASHTYDPFTPAVEPTCRSTSPHPWRCTVPLLGSSGWQAPAHLLFVLGGCATLHCHHKWMQLNGLVVLLQEASVCIVLDRAPFILHAPTVFYKHAWTIHPALKWSPEIESGNCTPPILLTT